MCNQLSGYSVLAFRLLTQTRPTKLGSCTRDIPLDVVEQAPGHMHCMKLPYNMVTSVFRCQTCLQLVKTLSAKFLSDLLWMRDRNNWSRKWKSSESSRAHATSPNALKLFNSLWHYNRYFTFTHGNSTHPTLNPYGKHLTSENSSHHEHLHYGKMAAVSIRHNAYRKLCPVNSIALITFSILYT